MQGLENGDEELRVTQANRQQRDGDLSSITAKDSVPSITRMSLEEDFAFRMKTPPPDTSFRL